MKYTVTWSDESVHQLAALYEAGGRTEAFTQASATIDRRLKFDPGKHAEEVAEGLLSIKEPPLRCLFVIRTQDRTVDVVRIAACRSLG